VVGVRTTFLNGKALPLDVRVMITIDNIVKALEKQSQNLLLSQLVVFINVCSRLKKHILIVYDSKQPPDTVPPTLPPVTRAFLATTCTMSEEDVKRCWDAAGALIWKGDEHLDAVKDEQSLQQLFQKADEPFFREYDYF
jgi:hypothetical protein